MKPKEMKKRHHTVPRLYLEGFCDEDGMVWTYLKDNLAKTPYSQKPENVAIENFFYTFHGTNIDPNVFENALADIVETPAANSLKLLRECKIPSFDDRQLLSVLFGFMLVRTPNYKNISDELINKGLNLQLQNMAKNENSFQKSWEEYCKHTGQPPPEEIDKLRKSILKKEIKIELNSNYSLLVIQKLGFEVSCLLPSMKWIVCKAPHGANFITGDNPIAIENCQFNIFNPSLLEVPGTKIFIPIAKNVGLLMIRKDNETFDTELIADDNDTVMKMNKILFSNAHQYIYVSENNNTIKNIINTK